MKKSIYAFICAVLSVTLPAARPAAAQSTAQASSYILCGVTRDLDITLGNINPQSASVSVAFYRNSGDVVSTSFVIDAGKQSRLNPTSAGISDFSGSVVISSAIPLAVSASLLSGDTAFDFIMPSEAATTLVIPFAPLDTASMDVNIFNPGTEQADVKVIPVRADGTQNGFTSATVAPKHSTTVSLGNVAGITHLVIRTSGWFRGDRPVAANAFIHNYNPSTSAAVVRTDFAVVAATPLSAATASTILPYFAQGEDFFSIVEVVNLTNSEQTVKLTARHSNGSVISGSKNPVEIDIAGLGATRQSFADMFGVSVTELTRGIITIEGTGPLQAAVAIGNVSKPSLAVLPADDREITTFSYQLRRTGREFFNGITLWNNSGRDAGVTMSFIADDGRTVSTVPLSIPRGQLLSEVLAKLFPEAQGNGYLLMRSDAGLIASGIDGRSDGSALGTRRPLYASASFTVPPLERFLAVGTVLDEDVGVPNVAIRLIGPMETTTLTDAAGVFVFRDIPQGSYQLIPVPIGYSISPGSRSFSIANANSRNNDFNVGLTTPLISSLTPDGAVVNSESVTLTVEGSNFIAGNVVVFETTELPTTYVSETLLTATLDRSLLTASGEVAVAVRNRGPSGTYVDSPPALFTVGNAAPTLAQVTGQPNPLIAGSITSPFTITVSGSGFTPATQVLVDRAGRSTTFISQTEVRAVILPSDVSTPRLVPITVRNPGAVSSAPFYLPVLYPTPVVTSISPSSMTALVALDAQAVRVTVRGSGFIQDSTDAGITSVVMVDNVAVATEYVSSSQLIAIVPASLLSTAGNKQVAVKNPEPALGTSDAVALFVSNPAPTITSVNAGQVQYNPTQSGETVWVSVGINGTNFSSESVAWVSLPCDTSGFRRAQTTQRISATQILATIPIRCAGNYQLQIRTPQPGGGASNTFNLSIAGTAASSSFVIRRTADQ